MTLCLPFLMFQGRAGEAVDLYLDAFPDAELLELQHHPRGTEILDTSSEVSEDLGERGARSDGAAETVETAPRRRTGSDLTPAPAGEEPRRLVASAQINVGGQVLMIQDSLVVHDFSFTPSTSIAVVVDSRGEFDGILEKLSVGGTYLMEPGPYDFARNFAWLQDRFGVCWQINHPLSAPDEESAQAQAPDWG